MAVSEDSDIKQENAHLKEIEELIFDQDLIITYKRLSKLLNVHVNKAKRLLSLFVENARKGKRPVSASYLISGKDISEEISAWRVCVVPEDQLEVTKKRFSPEGLSDHVYSVHQGSKVLDTGALISASKSDDNTARFGAIKNHNAKPREQDVMQQLAKKAAMAAISTAPEVKATSTKAAPTNNKKPEAAKKETEIKTEKQTEEVKKEPGKASTSTISSMFAAQNSKPADTNGKPAPKPAAAASAKGGKKAKAGGNIASFFQRQKDAPKQSVSSTSSTESSPVSNTAKPESSQGDSDAGSQVKVKLEQTKKETSPKVNGNSKKVTTSKPSKTSKKRKSKSETEAPKKRKRIQIQSDSESSDEDSAVEVMEDDTPPPPVSLVLESDDEEKPTPSSTTSTVSTVKERKLVDKVFKDEKGFIVTKKEWVVETHTQEMEVTEVKKSPKKEVEKESAPVKKKQQSDIMSFFGRK